MSILWHKVWVEAGCPSAGVLKRNTERAGSSMLFAANLNAERSTLFVKFAAPSHHERKTNSGVRLGG